MIIAAPSFLMAAVHDSSRGWLGGYCAKGEAEETEDPPRAGRVVDGSIRRT